MRAVLIAGLVAGVLDIIFAFVVYGAPSYGMSPLQVLQSVAGGWVGRDAAMAGGVQTAALGAATHFAIALVMAAVFAFFASFIRPLRIKPILWGFLYGLVLYVAMNYVVAPLSAAGAAGHFPANTDEAIERIKTSFSMLRPTYNPELPWMIPATIGTHVLLVGIPIALIVQRFSRPRIDVA